MSESCQACERQETATRALGDRGVRITTLRKDVLQTLHHAQGPLGAYEVFDSLKQQNKASAPPAVYRVLDFLVEQGLAHKLQSISAYTACCGAPEPHDAMFLICRKCNDVQEQPIPMVSTLMASIEQAKFSAEELVLEVSGLCQKCGKE